MYNIIKYGKDKFSNYTEILTIIIKQELIAWKLNVLRTCQVHGKEINYESD